MLTSDSAKAVEGLEGLNFAEVLGKCLSVALVVVDSERKLWALNPDAEKLLALPASSVLRGTMEPLPAALREVLSQTFDQRKPQAREINLPSASEPSRSIQVTTTILPVKEGNGFGVVAVLHD